MTNEKKIFIMNSVQCKNYKHVSNLGRVPKTQHTTIEKIVPNDDRPFVQFRHFQR